MADKKFLIIIFHSISYSDGIGLYGIVAVYLGTVNWNTGTNPDWLEISVDVHMITKNIYKK